MHPRVKGFVSRAFRLATIVIAGVVISGCASTSYPPAPVNAASPDYNWIIASLVFLMGVTIRHWFNTRHARAGSPHWTWGVTVILFLIIAWLSTAPMRLAAPEAALQGEALRLASAKGFDEVVGIVQGRCAMCHAAEPAWDGLHWPPKGVVLETPSQIAHAARRIYLQAGVTPAMPPGNLSSIEPAERAKIVAWFQQR